MLIVSIATYSHAAKIFLEWFTAFSQYGSFE